MEQDTGELAAKVLLRMNDVRGWIAGLVLILTSPVWAAGAIVLDGDTLTLGGTKSRLDGIDAPEFNQICLDEKGQPWKRGFAARDALAKLIANRTVQCEDEGIDKVHRERRIGICLSRVKNLMNGSCEKAGR